MSPRYSVVAAACAVLLAATFSLPAQQTEHGEHADTAVAEENSDHSKASDHSKHDREWIQNEISLFLGATNEPGHSTEFTWGLEYVREISHHWGIGVLFDYAGGLRNAVIGVPVYYLPGGRWKLMAAPCIEFHRGRSTSEEHTKADAHGETDENEKHFLFRVSIGYDIILAPRYSLVPAVGLDFVKGERVWVYGFNFAYKF